MTRLRPAAFALALAAASPASAADERGPQGVWSGVYRCGPMQGVADASPGYASSVRMVVEGNAARINKVSADIRETLSGEVTAGNALRLSGTGARTESGRAEWRYRFDGRFTGDRFEAHGAMLSHNLETPLRECSMSLARVRGVESAPPEPAAPAQIAKAPADKALPPKPALQPSAEEPKRLPQPAGKAGADVERELDFSRRNESGVVEGTVLRGAPHRYRVKVRKGQRLTATLRSPDGARFDVYEPGATLTTLSGGFVVQGARVGGTQEGTGIDVELPADGEYLMLVRPLRERAFYTLDMTVARGTSSVGAWHDAWWRNPLTWIVVVMCAILVVGFRIKRRRRERPLFRSG